MPARHRADQTSFRASSGPTMTFRFEAEDFSGIGRPGSFRAKQAAAASAGELVQLKPGGSGSITLDLGGVAAGYYQLRVVYVDETDGNSLASVAVDGDSIGAWRFDGAAGNQLTPGERTGGGLQPGNFRSLTLDQGFAVGAGSVLALTVARDGAESARIDYVELIAANGAPTALTLGSATVNEGAFGAVVGRLTVTDPNAGDSFTFTVDDARFTVNDSGQLKLKPAFALDFETEATVTVRVTATDAGGLSTARTFALDVIDRAAEIDLISLDGPLLDDRLAFSHLENTDGRTDKDVATLRIANSGGDPLQITGFTLSGPFAFVDPAQDAPATVAADGFLDIAIRFDPAAYEPGTDPDIFTGALTIASNDADEPSVNVDLSGFWQFQPESGREPTVNEVWETFGYANRVNNAALNNFDIVETITPQEVTSQYWQLAAGATAVSVTWIASYHGRVPADVAIHAPGDAADARVLFTQAANENQRVLPTTTGGTAPITSFDPAFVPNAWAGDDVFGFRLQGESSDWTLNPPGPGTPPDPDAERGYFVRFFKALDADGDVIPDTWLVIQDYNSRGINYDFNDNMLLISGVTPATGPFGP